LPYAALIVQPTDPLEIDSVPSACRSGVGAFRAEGEQTS
jgi:hypothetical protein